MPELILALMTWISAHTGLPVPEEHPRLVFAEHCQLQRAYYGDGTHECTEDGIQAFYMHDADTIYLPDTWKVESLNDVSTLLHELVHHMQFHAGKTPENSACPAAQIEKPAYDAQIDWLRAAGVDAFEVMGINDLSYFYLTACNPYQ